MKTIGDLAEKYEVGNRGPGYISDGDKWDPGGDSYGSYQLATKVGTLQGYLKTSLPYVKELNQFTMKSAAFNQLWRNIASNDPDGFKNSQLEYVKTISYNPCRKYATKIGIADTFAINSALFSISNQHGGWKKILNAAGTDSDEVKQINKLYEARTKYINSLKSLSAKLKRTLVENRCIQERLDCINLVNENPVVVLDSKPGLIQTVIGWFLK